MARQRRSKADETAENAWLEILEAAGEGSGSVGVWRKLANGERDYLGTATVEEMRHDTLEVIRERWGGGKFVVQLKDDAGKFMAGTRSHFQIAGPAKDPNATPTVDPKLEALEKKLEELSKGAGPETMVMVELIRQMGELRKPVESPKGDSVADILKALSPLLAPLLAKLLESKDPAPGPMDRLEELTQLMELAKGMQGPQDGIAALAKPLAEPIGKLLSAHAEGAPAAANGAQPNPQETPVADGRPPWYNFLAPIVPQALRWATTGKDVAFRADFIVDELADEQLGPVHATLTSPGFREAFYTHFPEAVPHVAWFDALFQRIVYNIMDEDEIAAAEGDGAGDELEHESAELEEARAPTIEVEAEVVEELPPDPPAEVGGPGTPVAGVEIL